MIHKNKIQTEMFADEFKVSPNKSTHKTLPLQPMQERIHNREGCFEAREGPPFREWQTVQM